jgi:hypothetical protein
LSQALHFLFIVRLLRFGKLVFAQFVSARQRQRPNKGEKEKKKMFSEGFLGLIRPMFRPAIKVRWFAICLRTGIRGVGSPRRKGHKLVPCFLKSLTPAAVSHSALLLSVVNRRADQDLLAGDASASTARLTTSSGTFLAAEIAELGEAAQQPQPSSQPRQPAWMLSLCFARLYWVRTFICF